MPTSGALAVQPTPAAYLGKVVGDRKLRLGSRTSPMAIAQARNVASALSALVPRLDVTINGVTTSADTWDAPA